MKRDDLGTTMNVELEGIYAGLIAGALLLLSEMIVATQTVAGGGFSTPLVAAASLVMGSHATEAPLIEAMLAGLAVHAGLSAGFGFVFGVVASDERLGTRRRSKLQGLLGGLFGAGIWFVSFVLVAPAFYPWIVEGTSLWVQLILLVSTFGVPMGLTFAFLEEQRGGRALV